jgi:hypothetical protein
MAEGLLPDPKEQARLAHAIAGKVAAGFRIESQSDLQALLVRDPRRRLGIMRLGGERRELLSINQWGHLQVEQL